MMPESRPSIRNHWFRVWMPYQFIKLDVPRPKHVYLPLNRNYKPLGVGEPMEGGDWVEYPEYARQAVVFTQDPHQFEGVWHDREHLYLYNDNLNTQVDYFERLGRLMNRTVKLYGAPNED